MQRLLLISLLALSLPVQAIDKSEVRDKWHTPFDLYLTAQEAFDMKSELGDKLLFVDVRTRPELKYVGMPDSADVNIPIRTLDTRFRWSDRASSFRTRSNPLFLKAMEKALESKGLDKNSPVILMCQSGGRSPIAARELHEAGFTKVYTLYDGFEGVKATEGPNEGQRVVNGWKNAGLPWSYKLDKEKMYFPETLR
ncbi:MAG: rhodanese-like domain-containing protein [Gammaproteobacteria bacterium]